MASLEALVGRMMQHTKEKEEDHTYIIARTYPAYVDYILFPHGFFQPQFKMFNILTDLK